MSSSLWQVYLFSPDRFLGNQRFKVMEKLFTMITIKQHLTVNQAIWCCGQRKKIETLVCSSIFTCLTSKTCTASLRIGILENKQNISTYTLVYVKAFTWGKRHHQNMKRTGGWMAGAAESLMAEPWSFCCLSTSTAI